MNTLIKVGVVALALPIAGCATAVKEDDPYAVKVRQMEQRLETINRVLDSQSLVQLMGRIEELQNEVRTLRGEVETLRYDLDGVRQRQRDVYLDLDQRLQALESGAGAGGVAATSNGNDRDAYQAAFALLREARYEEAKAAFKSFLETYPQSSLVPNAWYWLGEVNYVNKNFDTAIGQFRTVVDEFPQSTKAADAWLKLGYSHYELEQWAKANEALRAVAERFPQHPAAGLANERLERMTREGR